MLNTPFTTEDLLGSIGLFEGVSEGTLKQFRSQMTPKKYAKNEMVFAQGDSAYSFYVIKKGWVKLSRQTLDGEEAIIDILTEGHIFGETTFFEDVAYSFNAEAVEASQLISFPLPILKEAIMSDGTLSYNMLSGMSRRRQQQDLEIEHRTVQNASQRIGCFLLRLCKPDMASPIRLNLPYDKMLLASRLGMKPETFSRALNRLRKETDIRITGATIEFDSLSQLSTYSCSACSTAFPCVDHH